MIFHENRLVDDDSHEISYFIFFENRGTLFFSTIGEHVEKFVFCCSRDCHFKGKLFACWVILHAFCCLLIFFQNQCFLKFISGLTLECQTVWIQIRPDKMSGLTWFQTVCKGYQADDTSRQRI